MGLVDYLRETRGELRHVSWPTQKQVIQYTALVIFLSIATAAYLGFFDAVFSYVLKEIVTLL